MPISPIDGCDEAHWLEVRTILGDAIRDGGFDPSLVSDADDIGIIQKRIIQNLYENPIVVCDVSGKNPNVMFELGLRLAFDKPTLIVKDDKTAYSFDTAPIEHLAYPRDLRFAAIVEFKRELTRKLKATYTAATNDSQYTTFLKHFGTFSVAKLESKEVSGDQIILEELRDLRESVSMLSTRVPESRRRGVGRQWDPEALDLVSRTKEGIRDYLRRHNVSKKVEIRAAREKICDALEDELGPRYFDSRVDYESFFNKIFDLLYS
ncbi:MAG: hypothetical protein QOI07_2844 [Verrucomicrobiota bacterium]